jgi:L-lactate dehydrogenase (cytochrome)
LETFIDGVKHPRWTLDFLTHDPITFSAVAGRADLDGSSAISLVDYVNEQFDSSLTWDDLEWIRSESGLPVMIKGVQSVQDAQIAARVGLDAISLSNHGGRQLDDSPAPLDLLPSVVDAVGDSLEVLIDGGVRRGSDVVKAVSLGARAVMIGRPYLYGLGAAGREGVEWVIDFFEQGIRRSLALVGEPSVQKLNRDFVTRDEVVNS